MNRLLSLILSVPFSAGSLDLRLSFSVFLVVDILEELSHDRDQVWLRMEFSPIDSSTELLSLVLLEVSNINFFLDVDLSDFLDLVVVDEQLLALKDLLVKIEFGTNS